MLHELLDRVPVFTEPLPPAALSMHFPPNIRGALQRAAETEIPPDDPMARVRAVNAAIARARAMHPDLFRHEGES